MDIDKLLEESTAFDYKLMLEEKRPKSWLKSVSAFANGMGGSLFFGVSDNREVMGLKDVQHVMETLKRRIRLSLSLPIRLKNECSNAGTGSISSRSAW